MNIETTEIILEYNADLTSRIVDETARQIHELEADGIKPEKLIVNEEAYEQLIIMFSTMQDDIVFPDEYMGLDITVIPVEEPVLVLGSNFDTFKSALEELDDQEN